MRQVLFPLSASLCCGLVFGFGLALAGMLDPTRVQGFLNVFGHWDPSLAFVLGGAVATSFIGLRIARWRGAPTFAGRYELPSKQKIDSALIVGSAIFGVGWGLSGLCPGPAVASLSLGLPRVFAFVAAMLMGMLLFRLARYLMPGQAEQRATSAARS